jgi:hypothetical protein
MLYLTVTLSGDPTGVPPDIRFLRNDQAARQVQEKHSDYPYPIFQSEQNTLSLLYILYLIE